MFFKLPQLLILFLVQILGIGEMFLLERSQASGRNFWIQVFFRLYLLNLGQEGFAQAITLGLNAFVDSLELRIPDSGAAIAEATHSLKSLDLCDAVRERPKDEHCDPKRIAHSSEVEATATVVPVDQEDWITRPYLGIHRFEGQVWGIFSDGEYAILFFENFIFSIICVDEDSTLQTFAMDEFSTSIEGTQRF